MQAVQVKALACEPPATRGVPLSRWSTAELAGEEVTAGTVEDISASSVARRLATDALKPWRYRSWMAPRSADFAKRAATVLDLYAGVFEGEPLGEHDCRVERQQRLLPPRGPPWCWIPEEIGATAVVADVTDSGQVGRLSRRSWSGPAALTSSSTTRASCATTSSGRSPTRTGTRCWPHTPAARSVSPGRWCRPGDQRHVLHRPARQHRPGELLEAKAGIIGFTKTTAKELARFGITVNAISPNAETRMVASIPEAKLAELAAAIPLGRFAAQAETASAVAFLASNLASYVTGVVLAVDGGMSI